MFCVAYLICNCMLTQKTKHAIGVREVLTGNNLFWLELSFHRERRASFAARNT